MTLSFNKSEMKEGRRTLRKNMTAREAGLWDALRNKQLSGYKFRRRYSIGMYIVDSYSPRLKLAIAVDGPSHEIHDAIEYDKLREDEIKSLGIQILRLKNEEIEEKFSDVLKTIADEIRGWTTT